MLLLLLHLYLFITCEPLLWFRFLRLGHEVLALGQLLLVVLLRGKVSNIFIVEDLAIVLFLCDSSSLLYQLLKLVAQVSSVFTLIHFVNDFLPLPVFNLGILYRFAFLTYFLLTFLRILFSQYLSEHIGQALLDMCLHKPKLFITFILENLCKKSNFMIISQICFNTCYQRTCPLYDQRLQPILLI